MIKKAGILTIGVSAALLTAAPLASAGEAAGEHNGDNSSHSKGNDDHGKGHHKEHGKDHGKGNTSCASQSGDVKRNEGKGLLAGAGSILSGNSGQLASCNSVLNNNVNHNKVNVASPIFSL